MRLMTTESPPRPSERVRRDLTAQLLDARPEALVEAVQILSAHRDEIVKVMTRYGYSDPKAIGGYLDRDLPTFAALETGR